MDTYGHIVVASQSTLYVQKFWGRISYVIFLQVYIRNCIQVEPLLNGICLPLDTRKISPALRRDQASAIVFCMYS